MLNVHVECTTTSLLTMSIEHTMVNELAEPYTFLPNGWGPPASPIPASNDGVPGVRVSTPSGPVSSRGITAFVPDSMEL